MADTLVNVNRLSKSVGQKAGDRMSLQSPAVAILWENWRLTRAEAAWKLAVQIVGGLAVLAAFVAAPNQTTRDFGAVVAMIVIGMPNILGWFSIPKINGARPGFPFSYHYARPVRTAVLVGVPMAYQVVVPVASYLMSAFVLRVTSGYPFPLLPVAAWIAALNMTHAPVNWAIPNRAATVLGSLVAGLPWVAFVSHRINPDTGPEWNDSPSVWPQVFDIPLTDYALIAAIGLASFGVTVAGVARQRRGDASEAVPWAGVGFPEWVVNLFRFPCPTSSPARAQVWFDLKSRGLPVLAIGVALSLVNPLLFAITVYVQWLRPIAAMCGIFSLLTMMFFTTNAFGIRWKPGRWYASAFELAQPFGTAHVAGIKVLVRSVCMLIALSVVGVSVWASMAFIAVGEGNAPLRGYQPLRSWQGAVESAAGTLTGYELVALVVVAAIGVAIMTASLGSFAALMVRYPRRLNIGGWLVLLHGLVLIGLVLTGYRGFGSKELWDFLVAVLVWITRWIDTPAIVVATLYVGWRVFAERLLTLRSACAVVLMSVAFAAAWVTLLGAAGVQLADMSTRDAAWMLSPTLLPLLASVLAPWSFSRVRHI